jgi:hypothetical protein
MNKIARVGLVALTGAGIALAGGAPAVAAPRPGDCPTPFITAFVDEESGPILAFDKNGDSLVCLLPVGGADGGFNVIDNKVRPS